MEAIAFRAHVKAMTTFTQLHIAVVVTFDLDLRKNFDASVRARYGPPIIQIPNLHPGASRLGV